MKRLILVISIIPFLLFPFLAQASYNIMLKNGGEIKTTGYWKENDQIKFYTDGGVAGIYKTSIRRIEKVAYENELYVKPRRDLKKGEVFSENQDMEGGKKEANRDIEYYKNKKEQLTTELAKILDELREATKNRDSRAKERAKDEMRRVSGEISSLTQEVKQVNSGKVPEGWMREE